MAKKFLDGLIGIVNKQLAVLLFHLCVILVGDIATFCKWVGDGPQQAKKTGICSRQEHLKMWIT